MQWYAFTTVQLYKTVVKAWFKWLNSGEYPEEVKWLRTRKREKALTLIIEPLTVFQTSLEKRMLQLISELRKQGIVAKDYLIDLEARKNLARALDKSKKTIKRYLDD